MEFKDSLTRQNLLKAFAGESQARNKYTFFATKAIEEGYPTVATIFLETANHEMEHAKRFFSFLKDGEGCEITATFPAGKIGTTVENLMAAAHGEHEEFADLYPEFAKIAREEGFEAVAKAFENIATAESFHEDRFNKLIEDVSKTELFKKSGMTIWKCSNCGYHATAADAPKVCPACLKPQNFFVEVCAELF